MERLLVFQAREAPDRALDHLERGLAQRGYEIEPGDRYDIVARRLLDKVFVGLAPHPRGLVARVKAKGLLPGRASGAIDVVAGVLGERLGTPVDRFDPAEADRA